MFASNYIASNVLTLFSWFLLGISSKDFLCVSKSDEDECLSSRLDGDEITHQQVSADSF